MTAAEATTSTSFSSEMLLQGLAKLHSAVEDILNMPESQAAISRCKNQKWVTEELDGSVRLLDIFDSTRDSLSAMKEQAQELQSMVRTRRALTKSCASNLKKTTKEISKCLKDLKQMERRRVVYPNVVVDDNASSTVGVIRALKELREMTITVCNCVLSSFQYYSRSTTNWSLVSKTMGIKSINKSVSSRMDVASLCKNISSSKDCDLEKLQLELNELESGVEDLGNGFQSLFQGLIRNRVAILNILNM